MDENQNQVHDFSRFKEQRRAFEPGIPGVTVVVTDSPGVIRSDVTDANGVYSVSGVAPGPATVNVVVPRGFFLSTPPNPRSVVVPPSGGTHTPIPGGTGLVRVVVPVDPITSSDRVAVLVGGIVIALLLLACCFGLCCRLPGSIRRVRREVLPLPPRRVTSV